MESPALLFLSLLMFPVAPVQVAILLTGTMEKIEQSIGDSPSFLLRELVLAPTLPFFLIGLVWYIHQYRPDLIDKVWPTKILYLVLLYDLITNIYWGYIANLGVTGAPIRLDKFLTGGLVWVIIGYLFFG